MQRIPTGSFVWHNLVTPDAKNAAAFYSEIANWHTTPWEYDERDFTLFTVDGEEFGGAVAPASDVVDAAPSAPRWVPYVYVYDVDACARQAAKIGGSLRKGPFEVPNVGSWAIVGDPQGATLGLFEPEVIPPEKTLAPRATQFSWHELMTTDYHAAFEFYKQLFHWTAIAENDMGEHGTYLTFGQNGQACGGMFNKPGATPSWLSYLRVNDVKIAAQTAQRLGATVHLGPVEVPGGDWIVQCTDREGAPFAMHAPRA
ncbi:MAG TPA: VOC family protein [Gemmatimonadaceae bacterium]|nr:VOC family protein [Gemmatimonadaceae bacterium]